jgi:hypothetical protein
MAGGAQANAWGNHRRRLRTEARDVLTDAQNLHEMACAVAAREFLRPFL